MYKMRQPWEVLFSLFLAVMIVGTVAATNFTILAALSRVEARVKIFLHLRQTDYVRGYIALWLPSTLLAFLIWIVLHVSARCRFTKRFLGSAAGVITIVGPFAFWVVNLHEFSWPIGWIYCAAPFETIVALVCALRFLAGKWGAGERATFLLVAAHYIFWYYARFSPNANPCDPYGPGAFITPLGICAALTWGAYVISLRTANTAAE